MKKDNKAASARSSAQRSKKAFMIFTSAFLGCVLIVGIVFGTIGIVKNKNAVMKYKGVYLSDGVANYLIASYKYDFMSSLAKNGEECYDTDIYWQSEAADGKTWGDVLAENTEKYLKSVIIGSYLFDKNTSLTKNDKAVIEKAVNEVLDYRADGNVERFNEIASDMGFTYRDFEKAAEMLYKYEMAQTVIFGYDGSALESGLFNEECNEYFEGAYSRVMLMFIRTDGELVTDPETGKEILSEYDDNTKAIVEEKIAYIRKLINNAENHPNEAVEQMSEGAFMDYIAKDYPTGTINDTEGYYFSKDSSYSLEFAEGAPEVVSLALGMEEGHYAECAVDFGVCFIYKIPLEENAYSRILLTHFFSDFYAKAASYIYGESITAYLPDVTVKSRYDSSAVLTKPYNKQLPIKFG